MAWRGLSSEKAGHMNATNGAPAEVRPKGWVLALIREAAAADRLYPTDQMLSWAREARSARTEFQTWSVVEVRCVG